MSMSDELFEETMVYFEGLGKTGFAANLRARDTAQREALARVEAAYANRLRNVKQLETERDTAQAQLAEALALLEKLVAYYGGTNPPNVLLKARSFLARHAQAEQQEAKPATFYDAIVNPPRLPPRLKEAQGAQAGEELVAKAIYDADRSVFMSKREYAELHHTTKVRLLKIARAALATQPAAGEPVAEMISHPKGKQLIFLVNGEVELPVGTKLYKAAPPAAAHGEEFPSEQKLEAAGLGYPLSKEEAVQLWYQGLRSEVITVLETWEAIGNDIGTNPGKDELLESLRYMRQLVEQAEAGEYQQYILAAEFVRQKADTTPEHCELLSSLADELSEVIPEPAAHGDEAVRKDATESAIQRACGVLPEGWSMQIDLERDAGWVTLFNPWGRVVDFGQDFGSIGAHVEAAIDAAMRAQGDGEVQ